LCRQLPENIPELQALVEEANARLAVTENASRDILEAYENNKTQVRPAPLAGGRCWCGT